MNNYKIVSKFLSKLGSKILVINILDSILIFKKLIETNLKYKLVNS